MNFEFHKQPKFTPRFAQYFWLCKGYWGPKWCLCGLFVAIISWNVIKPAPSEFIAVNLLMELMLLTHFLNAVKWTSISVGLLIIQVLKETFKRVAPEASPEVVNCMCSFY